MQNITGNGISTFNGKSIGGSNDIGDNGNNDNTVVIDNNYDNDENVNDANARTTELSNTSQSLKHAKSVKWNDTPEGVPRKRMKMTQSDTDTPGALSPKRMKMTLSNIDSKNQSCHRQTISETSKGSDSELGNECHLGKIAIGECLSINELQSRTGSSPPSQDHLTLPLPPPLQDHLTSPPPPSPHRDYLTLPCRIRHHQRIGTRLRDAFLSARGNQVLIEGGGNGDGGGGGGGKMALESRTIIDYMSRIVSRYNDRCLLSRGKGFYFIQVSSVTYQVIQAIVKGDSCQALRTVTITEISQ